MEQKQFDIFLAAYFSDKEKLDGLLNTSNDLDLCFKITYTGIHIGNTDFRISVLDILQMNLDCWASLKEKEELNSTQPINPKIFYTNTLECFENTLKLFPDIQYHGINYEHYIFLISGFDDDEHWLGEAEMKAYETEGYKTIDLELINYGVRRNAKKVSELLDNGANPMIAPQDKTSESEILEILGLEDSFYFTYVVPYHEQKVNSGYDNFKIADYIYMIMALYGTASSAKLYNIIHERMKERNI